MRGLMPAPLKAIQDEVDASGHPRSNLDRLRPLWEEYTSEARQLVPGVHIEGGGEMVWLGELSPGCRACKEGGWDCVFVTMRCNLNCPFCYSPHAISPDYAGSAFGSTPEQIAGNYQATHITGVSFSGGEPFSDPQNLFAWIEDFKARCPDKYYWVYTNGLLADTASLQRLGALGVDEIRFNAAASGYDHRTVLRNIAAAARYVPNVTVEIPAIPEHAPRLLASLERWCALGVKFLNLHELMYEPGTNAADMPGDRQPVVTADGHHTEINPASRRLTLAAMKKVKDEGLSLSVNDCSLQGKLRQLRRRRRSLAPLTKAAHEKMVGEEVYETVCAYRGEAEYHFFHPDAMDEMLARHPDHAFIRLARTAPLSLDDPGRWVEFEEIDQTDSGLSV